MISISRVKRELAPTTPTKTAENTTRENDGEAYQLYHATFRHMFRGLLELAKHQSTCLVIVVYGLHW